MSPFTPLFSAASCSSSSRCGRRSSSAAPHGRPRPRPRHRGHPWFKDLTVGDPYYILPATMSASFLAMIYVGDAGQAGTKDDEKQLMMKRFMMVMAPVIGVATANFEAGVFVYWSAANSLTLLQSAVLRVPAARAAPAHRPAADPGARRRRRAALAAAAPKPFIPAPRRDPRRRRRRRRRRPRQRRGVARRRVFSTPPPKARAKQRRRKSKKKRMRGRFSNAN